MASYASVSGRHIGTRFVGPVSSLTLILAFNRNFFSGSKLDNESCFPSLCNCYTWMEVSVCVWLVIPLGRCVTDAPLRSVERGRFRLVLVVNIALGLCVTENNHTKFLLFEQMERDHCCN